MAIPPSALEGRLDRTDVVATLASAFLLNLAGPPGFGPLVFLALVPFLLRWARRRRWGSLLWSVRLGALLFGAFWALELLWVLRITRTALWAIPAWLGQVAILALLGALFGLMLHGGRRLPLALTAPLAWGALEVIRADLLGPLRFAWHPLALSLADTPLLLQPAAWIGETGLGIAVVLVSSLLAAALYRRTDWMSADCAGMEPGTRGSAGTRLALAAVVVIAWVAFGTVRMNGLETRPVAALVLVQPAIPLEVRRDSVRAVETAIDAIEPLLEAAVRAGAGEIVLPETALPMLLDGDSARAIVEGWVARTGRPVWVGGYTATAEGGLHNALVRFDRGGEAGRWEKRALVPGVEWGPGNALRSGAVDQTPIPFASGVSAESEGDRRSEPAGALICIESTRGDLVRTAAERGATWLVNVTNDAWLAESPGWTRTLAFRTHPAHLRLRAVESGLGVVRVANNGLSGTVDPSGRWTEALPPHLAGVMPVRVHSLTGPTPWLRWGAALRWVVLAGGLLLLLRAREGATS